MSTAPLVNAVLRARSAFAASYSAARRSTSSAVETTAFTEPMPWPLIRCALASPARLAILPMQDLLALDGRHRMNLPGTHQGNWLWRLDWEQIPPALASRTRHLVALYGRLRSGA